MKLKHIIQGVAYLLCLGSIAEIFINNYNKFLVIVVLVMYGIAVMFLNHVFRNEK